MRLTEIKNKIPKDLYDVLKAEKIKELMPCQQKAIKAGLLDEKSLLVCTPTASGKTLVAEIAAASSIINGKGKAVYIVPLKALAYEKARDFKRKYSKLFKVALSIGDTDSSETYLANYDLIICTAEKLDSLIRHRAPWLKYVKVVVADEVHLLNDPGRGPTLEILLTILRQQLKEIQLLGLSATIGNPEELAKWLNAKLIKDDWRPVDLHKGIYHDGEIEFY